MKKFYILQGDTKPYNDKFYLEKVICLEVKNNKLKIDKDLSLDFVSCERFDKFMYNCKFKTENTQTTFKAFLNLEDLEEYIKENKDSIYDWRKND